MSNKNKALIIRSASFQQLDNNLPSIKEHFPGWELHILTHEHGSKLAEKYGDFSSIHIYPHQGAFKSKRIIPGWESWNFDAVIVLVPNLSGVGLANVFRFAASLNASALYMCNMMGEIVCLKPKALAAFNRRNIYCRLFEASLGTVFGVLCAAWLALCLPMFRLILPHKRGESGPIVS